MEFFRNLFKSRRDRVAYLDFIERSEEALREHDARNDADFGFRSAARALDLRRGMVHFHHDQTVTATARLHYVGALQTDSGTWQWAWADSTADAVLLQAATVANKAGHTQRMDAFTTPRFTATLIEAWGYCAATCELASARGAFTERIGTALAFFVFDEIAAGVPIDAGGP